MLRSTAGCVRKDKRCIVCVFFALYRRKCSETFGKVILFLMTSYSNFSAYSTPISKWLKLIHRWATSPFEKYTPNSSRKVALFQFFIQASSDKFNNSSKSCFNSALWFCPCIHFQSSNERLGCRKRKLEGKTTHFPKEKKGGHWVDKRKLWTFVLCCRSTTIMFLNVGIFSKTQKKGLRQLSDSFVA